MERLSPDDIRNIHDYMIHRYNGILGENEPGLIDFMADKPFSGFGDEEYYPGLFMKAAVYMESFATHQLFCDGNKRTGYMCAKVFLELNNYMLDVTDDELYDTTMAVANKEMDIDELAVFIRCNSHLHYSI
ncbi:type II toxin-antitoxin system death-on-curing family toxin (plasmid) [Paenibacillus sp. EC2-1]|uniref:type II toxin-antitoxin system death-on-curing family toxin n=1 Tax=Paenibacillus sp. EC2-1 TaxID=3388665 RepID=UPI003BEEEAFC